MNSGETKAKRITQIMSIPILVTPILKRNTANFPPGFSADPFLTDAPNDTVINPVCNEKQIEELKEEVRKELKATASKSSQLLNLIDSIQRLGLAYHFETPIEEALEKIYHTYINLGDNKDDDLAISSLRFRLLRQQGYHIPSDLFNKFKDNRGMFKESLIGDLEGLLALYEASHLRLHGEDILEEALAFTTPHLQSMATDSDNTLSLQVTSALKRPIRKCLTKVEARRYISIYQEDGLHNETLLELAKLDFNLLQSLHRKELSELTRWWKDLDFETKLPFARSRLAESYFWAFGVGFEPQYLFARKILTKVTALLTVVDDIYDAYGTYEELKLLTDAVERWDASCIDEVPDYMKCFYRALLDVYEEIGREMDKQGKLYRLYYAKEVMKRQLRAYFVEAKWLNQEYVPTMNEYVSNAAVSSGYPLLMTTFFVGMGDMVDKEAFDWSFSSPKIMRATCIIGRFMNDLVCEFEQKRVHIATGVECYMKQHGVLEKEARAELNKQVVNAWKDVNEECLKPTKVPLPLFPCFLNFAALSDVIYKDQDEYTLVEEFKDLIASAFIHPLPI